MVISQVSPNLSSIDIMVLEHKVTTQFRGGNIKTCLMAWRLTSDVHILEIIDNGLYLNFVSDPPSKGPFEYPRSTKESQIIKEEVENKKDGPYRIILNLKFLNVDCETHHFKMDSLQQAIHMMRHGSFLASILSAL